MGGRIQALFIALLGVLGTATPARAMDEGDYGPLVFEAASAAGSWVRFGVTAEAGAEFYVDFELESEQFTTASIADWIVAPYGKSSGLFTDRQEGSRTVVPALGLFHETEESIESGSLRLIVGFSGVVYPGAYTIVVTGNSDAVRSDGHIRLHAGSGIDIESMESGTGGFLYGPGSMDTFAHARTDDVEVGAASVAEVTVARPLFATMRLHGEGVAIYSGPRLKNATTEWQVLFGEPSGKHRFEVIAEAGLNDPESIFDMGWQIIGAPAG